MPDVTGWLTANWIAALEEQRFGRNHGVSIGLECDTGGFDARTMALHSHHERSPVSKLLVHIVTGPENPTRVALGFLVARTAAAAGHEVTLFLAGDGVDYLRDETMDAAIGVGTGSIREHYTALADAGGRLYASAMSSKARAIDAAAAGGKSVEFAKPDQLVELILDADQVVTY